MPTFAGTLDRELALTVVIVRCRAANLQHVSGGQSPPLRRMRRHPTPFVVRVWIER
jgi:hypothetical protein